MSQLTIQQNNAFDGQKPWYFVLQNGSIGNLTLRHIPDGWMDNELKLGRDKTYHGVIKSVSTKELTFYKEGKNYLQSAYESEGVNCEVTVLIYRYNNTSMQYELYHTGIIDFTTYKINEISVMVELASDSFWDKFLARRNLEVDLKKRTSIEGYNYTTSSGLDTLKVPDTNISNAADFYEISSGFITALNAGFNHVIPCTLGSSDFNECQSQTLKENTNDIDDCFFKQSEIARIVKVAGSASFEYLDGATWLTYLDILTLDADGNVILTSSVSSADEDKQSGTFTFDKDLTLYPGESLCIVGTINSLTNKFEWNTVDFDVTETVVGTAETDVKGYMVYDAFLRATQIMMDAANPFYSTFFGRTDTPLTTYAEDGELIGLVKGIYLRGYSSEPIVVKFNDLFNSLFSIYGLSLSHEVIGGVDKIRVENLAYAYSQEVVLDISQKLRSQDIEKSVDPELLFSSIELGYNKYEYEQTGGLFEYNTRSVWSTIIRPIEKVFKKVSVYRADYNGIKMQINSDDLSEDKKGDNDIFFLTIKRDGGGFTAKLNEGFDYVGGSFYAENSLNLDITPSRNLRRLNDFVRGSLMKELGSYLRWQTSDKPSTLESTKTGGELVDEDADILVGDLDPGLWHPETYSIECDLTYTEITEILANPKGLIRLSSNKFGWIKEMQTKNWDGMTEMTLLRANLDFVDPYMNFERDGVYTEYTTDLGTAGQFKISGNITGILTTGQDFTATGNWGDAITPDVHSENFQVLDFVYSGGYTYILPDAQVAHTIDPLEVTIEMLIEW